MSDLKNQVIDLMANLNEMQTDSVAEYIRSGEENFLVMAEIQEKHSTVFATIQEGNSTLLGKIEISEECEVGEVVFFPLFTDEYYEPRDIQSFTIEVELSIYMSKYF